MHQTSHALLQERLREALLAAAVLGQDDGGIGSVSWRAGAALHALLSNHPIDQHGRCRCCRGPRVLLGRVRRVCRVLVTARFYLYQPDGVLLAHLASELMAPTLAPTGIADPDATGQQPRVSADPSTPRHQTPAVSPPPVAGGSTRAGRPDPDHGGAGQPAPREPRSRRAPPEDEHHRVTPDR